MPDDRLFHKRLGHSDKVNALTDLEEIVWRTYILAADDFGVMRFAASALQDAHERLAKRTPAYVLKTLTTVCASNLIQTFEHQKRVYCYQFDWQDYQKIRYPMRTVNPRVPEALLRTVCTPATRWLFTAWPGGKVKLASWQPPDGGSEFSGNGSGSESGKDSGLSRAGVRAGGVFQVQEQVQEQGQGTGTVGADDAGLGRLVPKSRSLAAPGRSRVDNVSLASPSSTAPAADGNFAVIVRLAHEALTDLGTVEPSSEVAERVKQLCAERHIDYGAHPHVATGVVRRAVEAAATQRTLIPVAGSKGRGGQPASLGELAGAMRQRIESMRRKDA